MATASSNTTGTSKAATSSSAGSGISTSDDVEKCSICGEEPSSNLIIKDRNYQTLIKFYFESLEIDAKPAEFTRQSLCTSCFDTLVEFYDTNEILVILGREFNLAKQRLLNAVGKGVDYWQKVDKPLSSVQKEIVENLPRVKKALNVKLIKEEPVDEESQKGYTCRTFLKQNSTNGSKSKNSTAAESSDNYESDSTRKTSTSSSKSNGGSHKRRKDEESEELSDSYSVSSEKSPPTRKRLPIPIRNKAKSPRYNDSDVPSDNDNNDNDEDEMSTATGDTDDMDNQCKVCTDTFPNKAELFKHMREMHTKGKTSYPCLICKKVFAKINELSEHKKSCPNRRRVR